MRALLLLVAGACSAFAAPVHALEVSFDAYVDARLVVPPDSRGWVDGGLGKLRFGSRQPSPDFRLTEAVGQATLAVDDDLHALAVVRLEPEQPQGIDLLEVYAGWRPAAHGEWRWSAKAGAFFPPVSVENDDLGWTSPYTLTPSAINSWVGNELRTIGGEGTLAHTAAWGTLSVTASLFCCNEPAGVLIADRGWSLDDRPMGLFERVRIPDATAALFGMPVPARTGMFEDIDGHLGWYAQLKWSGFGLGEAAVLYYDNQADPDAATARDSAWRTRFWSVSLRARLFGATVLAQGLSGDTTIGYAPAYVTRFDSAYLLASYDIDEDWRVSARGDVFETRGTAGTFLNEDGHAVTAAVIWNTESWLRLTAEILTVDSRRREYVLEGTPTTRSDTQLQLGARVFL